MKPKTKKESHLHRRANNPHDIWYNGDEGKRIAKRRWKKKTSKYLRQLGKKEASED